MNLQQVSRKLNKIKTPNNQLPEWAAQTDDLDGTFKGLLMKLSGDTNLHGLNHLLDVKLSKRMRIFWLVAFLLALTFLIYVSYLLAVRFQRKQFQTVISNTKAPIRQLSFPVIIICNKNRLNWSRLPEVKRRYKVPNERVHLFESILTAYDALNFYQLGLFSFLANRNLTALNHINFTNVVEDMAWRCDELLIECRWLSQSYNCCELFMPRRQLMGSCLAFNEDKQRHSVQFGNGTGLVVRLQLAEENHAPANNDSKGFLLNVVEPYVWFADGIEIPAFSNTNVGVKAIFHYYSNDTRALTSQERKCVFKDEIYSPDYRTLPGYTYMLENCMAECQQRYLMKYCNCIVDLFYPPSPYPSCKLSDLPCVALHSPLMQYFEQIGEADYVKSQRNGMICNCLFNCGCLTWVLDIRKDVLKPYSKRENDNSNILNIYYELPTYLVFRTSLVYTWVDLLVSFGGIFGLCLGSSIISLIELCYFGFIDLPLYIWQRYEMFRR